jgi:hypothetical protein
MSDDSLRKSSQEVELDHLLAEEFACDPHFISRFFQACGLECETGPVTEVIAEPSLGGSGFGDLLVECAGNGRRVALLIEDKITASPAARQAERYRTYASALRSRGWTDVFCIVVAPEAWKGDKEFYDAHLPLEKLGELLQASSQTRLDWRKAIIERALNKYRSTGVKSPDTVVMAFKVSYLTKAGEWARDNDIPLSFPPLRSAYFDGDSWIEPIRSADLPDHCSLRHRCWTSVRKSSGLVDLIVRDAELIGSAALEQGLPDGATTSVFSSGKGIVVSLPVDEMRPSSSFRDDILEDALRSMSRLADWYCARFNCS